MGSYDVQKNDLSNAFCISNDHPQNSAQAILNAWNIYQYTGRNGQSSTGEWRHGGNRTEAFWVFPARITDGKQALWAFAGNLHKQPKALSFLCHSLTRDRKERKVLFLWREHHWSVSNNIHFELHTQNVYYVQIIIVTFSGPKPHWTLVLDVNRRQH